MLVSDWLLETRTALWENDFEEHNMDANYVAASAVLLGFQEDLSSLKKLVQHLPVTSKLFLFICASDLIYFLLEHSAKSISSRSYS